MIEKRMTKLCRREMFKLIQSILFVLLIGNFACAAAPVPLTIEQKDKALVVFRDQQPIMVIQDIMLDFHSWNDVQLQRKSNSFYRLQLTYRDVDSDEEIESFYDSNVIIDIKADQAGLHFSSDADWFSHVNIFMEDLGGHMFGVKQATEPYNQKSPDLRGLVQDVNAIAEHNRFRADYATAVSPMFFSTKGYVSFFNTFAEGRYQFAMNGRTELYHAATRLDWHVLDAPTLDHGLVNYYQLIGAPKQVPLWSTGPVIWRDVHKRGKQDVLDDTRRFTEMKIPFTGLFVDRPYSDGAHGWSEMNFGSGFSNPQEWIKVLNKDYHIHLMTWIAPMTFGDLNFPGRMAGYKGYFDLSNPQSVSEFTRRLTDLQYKVGVQGHKMDRGDENFPYDEAWYDRTPILERRSKFIWLYAKHTHEALADYWGEDQFNFARAAVQGTQPYLSAIWAGDVRTNWEGLRSNMANAIRASYLGFSNWGTDAGGFTGNTGLISEDLYLRWIQFGLWTGFFEIKLDGASGRGDDRAPWRYSESFQGLYRQVFEERMALIPYIYSLLNTAAEQGTLMKPLGGVYPDDEQTYDIWDQYLFGPSLLVAPIYNQEPLRKVYLPEGNWIDYYNGSIHSGKQWLEVEVMREHVPIFVKANSLIVKGNIYQGNDSTWSQTPPHLDIFYYPQQNASANTTFTLMDAGDTNKLKTIRAKISGNKVTLSIPGNSYGGKVHVFASDGSKHFRDYPVNKDTIITLELL